MEDFGGDGIDYNSLFLTNIVFNTAELAIDWAREVAHSVGFSVVQKRQKTRNGVKNYVIMCDRGGKYKSQSRDPQNPLRKTTSTKKCRCPFQFVIKEDSSHLGFGIIPHIGVHNHRLIKYSEGQRHMARLSPEEKNYVRQQTKAQVRPSAIARGLGETFGKESAPDIRQIYNLTSNIRHEARKGLNHAQHMLAMAQKYHYTYFFEKDYDTNRLTYVFMSHPEGLRLLRSYPYVIIIDSTYKTNLYKMPLVEIVGITPVGKTFLIAYALMFDETKESYVWLLEKLRGVLDAGVEPEAIVTDAELGLGSAIEIVFPACRHLLCEWHIEKNVEANAKLKLQSGDEGAEFVNKRWKPLVYSTDVGRYLRSKERLQQNHDSRRRNLVRYLHSTWLVHERKFVRCYTNEVLHFGTRTTSRVESAHAVLKEWLGSSTCALDSVWERVHSSFVRQHVEIHKSLESSRSRHLNDKYYGIFSLLNGYVSHKAIRIMEEEFDRGLVLGASLARYCGCSLLSTHGLLCSCKLIDLHMRSGKVHVEDCHMFWRTLEVAEDVSIPYTDIGRFRAMCDEAIESNPSIFREATMILNGLLHPQYDDLEDPAVKDTFKGRPRAARRTRTRNRSQFEHVQRQFPTSQTTSQATTQSNSTLDSMSSELGGAWDMADSDPCDFPYADLLPDIIADYLCGWYNPVGDGHCGYRVISHAIRGDEKHWMQMRLNLLNEIRQPQYREVYDYNSYDNGETQARINFPYERPCRMLNWMDALDLFGYATMNCWAICVIGHRFVNGNHLWDGSSTYLPLRAMPGFRFPVTIMWLLNTGDHWVRLKIRDDGDIPPPMPPINPIWGCAADHTVAGWDLLYRTRTERWRTLEYYHVPTSNRESVINLDDD